MGHLLLCDDFIAKHHPNPLSLKGLLLWAEPLLAEETKSAPLGIASAPRSCLSQGHYLSSYKWSSWRGKGHVDPTPDHSKGALSLERSPWSRLRLSLSLHDSWTPVCLHSCRLPLPSPMLIPKTLLNTHPACSTPSRAVSQRTNLGWLPCLVM